MRRRAPPLAVQLTQQVLQAVRRRAAQRHTLPLALAQPVCGHARVRPRARACHRRRAQIRRLAHLRPARALKGLELRVVQHHKRRPVAHHHDALVDPQRRRRRAALLVMHAQVLHQLRVHRTGTNGRVTEHLGRTEEQRRWMMRVNAQEQHQKRRRDEHPEDAAPELAELQPPRPHRRSTLEDIVRTGVREEQPVPELQGDHRQHGCAAWCTAYARWQEALEHDAQVRAGEQLRSARLDHSTATLADLTAAIAEVLGTSVGPDSTVVSVLDLLRARRNAHASVAGWEQELQRQWKLYRDALHRALPRTVLLNEEAQRGPGAFARLTAPITFVSSFTTVWPSWLPASPVAWALADAAHRLSRADREAAPLLSSPFAPRTQHPTKRARATVAVILPRLADVTAAFEACWDEGQTRATDAWYSDVLRPVALSRLDAPLADLTERARAAFALALDDTGGLGAFATPAGRLAKVRQLVHASFDAHVQELVRTETTAVTLAAALRRLNADVRLEVEQAEAFDRVLVQGLTGLAPRARQFNERVHWFREAGQLLTDLLQRLDEPPFVHTTTLAAFRQTALLLARSLVLESTTAFEALRAPDAWPAQPPLPEHLSDQDRHDLDAVVQQLAHLDDAATPAQRACRTWRAHLYLNALKWDYAHARNQRLDQWLRQGGLLSVHATPAQWAELWPRLRPVSEADLVQLTRVAEWDLEQQRRADPEGERFRADLLDSLQLLRDELATQLPILHETREAWTDRAALWNTLLPAPEPAGCIAELRQWTANRCREAAVSIVRGDHPHTADLWLQRARGAQSLSALWHTLPDLAALLHFTQLVHRPARPPPTHASTDAPAPADPASASAPP